MVDVVKLSIFIFLVCHAAPWLLEKTSTGFFSPAKLGAILGIVTTVPYLFLIDSNPEISTVYKYLGEDSFDFWVLKFSIIYSFGFLFYCIGVYVKPFYLVSVFDCFAVNVGSLKTWRIFLILVLLGVGAWYLRVQYAGGLQFLVNNMMMRGVILAGSGIYALVMDVALSGALIVLIYSFKFGDGYLKRVFLFFVFICFAAMFSVFGGRKTTLYLLIFALLAWTVCVGKIKRPLFVFVPISILVSIYFVAMLVLRGGAGGGVVSIAEFFDHVLNGFGDLFVNLSYVDTYLFILKNFSINDYWYGAGFGDLFISILPEYFGSVGRPPIDDGVYIRSLLDGYNVFPPTPFDQMYPSSWPPESFGNGFLNFGVVGVFVFMFVRGLVVGATYKSMLKSSGNPNLLFIYGFFVLNFHLTNLRIVQSLMVMVGALFVVFLYKISRVGLFRSM